MEEEVRHPKQTICYVRGTLLKVETWPVVHRSVRIKKEIWEMLNIQNKLDMVTNQHREGTEKQDSVHTQALETEWLMVLFIIMEKAWGTNYEDSSGDKVGNKKLPEGHGQSKCF